MEVHIGNYDEYRYRLAHPAGEEPLKKKFYEKTEEERSIEDYFYFPGK
jgi:hypothetical protein